MQNLVSAAKLQSCVRCSQMRLSVNAVIQVSAFHSTGVSHGEGDQINHLRQRGIDVLRKPDLNKVIVKHSMCLFNIY